MAPQSFGFSLTLFSPDLPKSDFSAPVRPLPTQAKTRLEWATRPFLQLGMEIVAFPLRTEAENQEETENYTHFEDGQSPLIAEMLA